MAQVRQRKRGADESSKDVLTHVALLRGINVGGGNRVEMKKLKATFESLGFSNVQTYINSGNVLFSSRVHDARALTKKIESGIKRDFGLDIKTLVLDSKSVVRIHKAVNPKWMNDDASKTDVMFLWEEFDRKTVLKELKSHPEVDTVRYVKGAILWNVDRKHYTKSGIRYLIGTKLYKGMTVRNINTLRKLRGLMGAK